MIENIGEKEKEIKEIWLKNRGEKGTLEIFREFLSPYFDTEKRIGGIRKGEGSPDWTFFCRWIKRWRAEEMQKEASRLAEDLTDEDANELLRANRRKTIVLLNLLLKNYETRPESLKRIPIREISKLYKILQDTEESMKRTEIAKGKLKLEAVRTLLPYQRMSVEDIKKLKESLNASFERILQLKSEESTGQDSSGGG